MLERAGAIADGFRARFEALRERSPLIQDIRAKGTMIGVELAVDGAPIVDQCLQKRLLVNCTHGNVLRLLPSLTLTDAELHQGCDILQDVLLGITL